MAEGDFAAFTATIGSGLPDQREINQAGGVLDWETEVFRDPSFTLVDSSRRIKVSETGRYLVRYDFGTSDNPFVVTTKTRSGVLATLRVNDVEQVWGRAGAYWRNAQNCRDGHASAAALLSLVAGDEVSVHAFRYDTEGANAGATVRAPGYPGQFSIWRLRDGWRLLRAKLSSDDSASTLYAQPLSVGTTEQADAGWSSIGAGAFEFDPAAAGAAYSALSHVFLVAVTVEALVTGTPPADSELEIEVQYWDGFGVDENLKGRALGTSYAENVGNCKRAVAGWCGLVEGINGETGASDEQLRVMYRHRNQNGTATVTPKAEKVSLQIVAIPRADIEYVHAQEAAGGQQAGLADAYVTLDNTVRENAPFDHDPAGDTSEVRVLTDPGAWVLAFASSYSRPAPL